jgi:hypothetical protein
VELHEIAKRELAELRRVFFYPPVREVVFEGIAGDPNFAGSLVGRKILVNQIFIEKMLERHVDPQLCLRMVIARALNRYIRVPRNFREVLQLYKVIRAATPNSETAKRFLEIYFALWNEIDLFENRGFDKELITLYRASLAIPENERKQLEPHYLVLVGILQERWGVDLGLGPLEGWAHLARELARLDYLRSKDREKDAKKFADLFRTCCIVVENQRGQVKDPPPPHWPLENTVDTLASPFDVREALIEFLNSEGEEGLILLADLTSGHPLWSAGLGRAYLLENPRWLYYETLANRYRIGVKKVPITSEAQLFNVSLRSWNPEDGVENLAPLASFGRIGLPGVTKKWLRAGKESRLIRQSIPDLLVLLDSSGSMVNPITELSYAVLAAFVAAQTYLDQGSKVAVINFSSEDIVLTFSANRTLVEKYLAAYQAGLTMLRVSSIEEVLRKAQRPVDILLISDMDIGNLEELIQLMRSHVHSHRIFVFLVCKDLTQGVLAKEKTLREKFPREVEWHVVRNEKDLLKIVLGTMKSVLD